MDTFTACAIIEGFLGGDYDEDQVIAAWQSLIDSGLVWRLQGFYGRTARNLIDAGICSPAQ